MKASELRIGSTYKSAKFNTPVPLHAGDIYELVNKADGANIDSYIDDMFEPIPLTEEWLLKLGFKDVNTGAPYLPINNDARIVFPIKNTDPCVYLEQDIEADYSLGWGASIANWFTPVKSVHQLQNLYFALTGEELKFNN